MGKREKATEESIQSFLGKHSGWALAGAALSKTFAFDGYPAGIVFVVALGFAAEKRDHHPELVVSWGKVRVDWTTHDAGGVTAVDLEMAELTDRLFEG